MTGNKVVDEIGQIYFEGNIIPASWFNHIKTSAGRTDSIAIIILSEIIYWYRPTVKRDEATGKIVETKKRFKADKLQRTYASFAEQFGFTKRQVVDAIKRLKIQGLITLELRTVQMGQTQVSNVLYLELVVERIKAITFDQRDSYHEKTWEVSRKNGIGIAKKRGTNTETTTATNNREHSSSTAVAVDDVHSFEGLAEEEFNIQFEAILKTGQVPYGSGELKDMTAPIDPITKDIFQNCYKWVAANFRDKIDIDLIGKVNDIISGYRGIDYFDVEKAFTRFVLWVDHRQSRPHKLKAPFPVFLYKMLRDDMFKAESKSTYHPLRKRSSVTAPEGNGGDRGGLTYGISKIPLTPDDVEWFRKLAGELDKEYDGGDEVNGSVESNPSPELESTLEEEDDISEYDELWKD